MAYGCVPRPFLKNAEARIFNQRNRRDDSYPVWDLGCLLIPVGCLFRGRAWPDCKKEARPTNLERRQHGEYSRGEEPRPRVQTKWPAIRISPCSLPARTEDDYNISHEDLNMGISVENSMLMRLPMELRQEIYGYVLGREENVLILLPFKVRAVPATHPIAVHGDHLNAESNQLWITDEAWRLFWPNRTAILRTCRQVYNEAIDLSYTGNNFVCESLDILSRFKSSIPPHRHLNTVRRLRVSLRSPDRYSPEHYERHWASIIQMHGLRYLDVSIEIEWIRAEELIDNLARALAPMSSLKGLHRCKIDVRLFHLRCYPDRDLTITNFGDTEAQIARIREAATRPRSVSQITSQEFMLEER